MAEHMLMTVLGLKPQETEYQLNGETYKSELAPVALYHLLHKNNQQPTQIRAFCTPDALSQSYPPLEKALRGQCDIEPVKIVDCDNAEESMVSFLNLFTCTAPQTGQLTVDVTHGFRHYSILMLLGAFQVSALRAELELRNVYYALWQPDTSTSPIIDLGRLLDLSHWIYATRTFRDTGSLIPMANLIRQRSSDSDQDSQKMATELTELSQAFAEALPLELGLKIKPFLAQKRIRRLKIKLDGQHRSPTLLNQELTGQVETDFRLLDLPIPNLHSKKADIPLDEAELERQAKLITRLYSFGNRAAAFGLMREWMVSWALLQIQLDSNWLDKKSRGQAEKALFVLTELDHDSSELLSESQQKLARFWQQLRDIRNLFAHHGMRRENIFNKKNKEIIDTWCTWTDWFNGESLPRIPLEVVINRYDRLIISPLGHTPGVLFSAIRNCCTPSSSPLDMCLIITSVEAKVGISEALNQAGFQGSKEILEFRDPFAGLEERKTLVKQAKEYILAAAEVHVNLTGGTTLMGLLAEEIANMAKQHQCLTSRFVLIDKRPPQEQHDTPYEVGEKITIESHVQTAL